MATIAWETVAWDTVAWETVAWETVAWETVAVQPGPVFSAGEHVWIWRKTAVTTNLAARSGLGSDRGVRPVFRPDVQGLRAVAVLAVIADHLFHWPTGGFVGVDIFFVISGYLITGLLLREHARTGTISFRSFYVRRIKRIVPASVLVLGVTVGASHWLLSASRARDTAVDAVWSFFFAGNWRFAVKGTDYFQQGQPLSPVQHFWSLAVEEQFYLVWPWLMLALLSIGARHLLWNQRQRATALGTVIGVITVVSFAWAVHQSTSAPTVAYFSTFTRAWELGIGALLAVAGSALTIGRTAVRAVLGWAGLVGILVSVFLVPRASVAPALWVALPVLATALVIAAGHGAEQRHLWPLTNPVCRYLGDVSFSLYLWHFPVAVLLVALLPSDSASYYVGGAALVFGLAIASYHLVEDPVRKSAWLLPRPRPRCARHRSYLGRRLLTAGTAAPGASVLGATVLGATVLVTGALLLGAFRLPSVFQLPGVHQLSGVFQPDTTNAVPLAATPNVDPPLSGGTGPRCVGAAAMDPGQKCDKGQRSAAVMPAVDAMDVDSKGAFGCWTDQNDQLKTCTYGAKGSGAVSVALVGDSHAAMLLPGLKQQLLANNWRLDTYLGWECQWTRGVGSECAKALGQIQQRMERGPKYDIIITTGARHKSGEDKAWVSGQMAKAWQPIADRGTKIVVVGDNPAVSRGALECIRRVSFTAQDSCPTPRSEALAETDALEKAASQVRGAYFVNLTSFFCGTLECPAFIGNVITYSDTEGHITGTFSETLAPYLVSAVKKATA